MHNQQKQHDMPPSNRAHQERPSYAPPAAVNSEDLGRGNTALNRNLRSPERIRGVRAALELLTLLDRLGREIALLQRKKDAAWHRLAASQTRRWNYLGQIDRLTAKIARLQMERDGAWRFLILASATDSEAHEALTLLQAQAATDYPRPA
jgi:hypothetical protein